MYVQCLHRIITGYYYCSKEDAIRLAALCLLERYGVPDKSLGSDKVTNYLAELVPGRLLNENSPSQLASEILEIYTKFEKDPDDPHAMDDVKGLYLSMLENLGSTRDNFSALCLISKRLFGQSQKISFLQLMLMMCVYWMVVIKEERF